MTDPCPMETGWLPDTPVADTLLRRFLHRQAEVNATLAQAGGGRVARGDSLALADTAGPVSYLNQALLLRPLTGADDPLLDEVESFFRPNAGLREDGPSSATRPSWCAAPFPSSTCPALG